MKSEDLLWELSRRVGKETEDEMRDEVLLAYREGSLSKAEASIVERRLGEDQTARRRLIELSGVRTEVPPAVRTTEPLRPRWVAAAAAVVVALGLGSLWTSGSSVGTVGTPLQMASQFESSVTGLTFDRSTSGPSASAGAGVLGTQVLPETMVTVVVEPSAQAVSSVEFALYRMAGGRAERVPVSELELENGRGSARFRVRAASLVGNSAGVRSFLAVAAPKGSLPTTFSWRRDESPVEVVSQGGTRFVWEHSLEVLEPLDGE